MGKKKYQNFDLNNEQLEDLRERMREYEDRGMSYVPQTEESGTLDVDSANIIDSLLESRRKYKESVSRYPDNTDNDHVSKNIPQIPKPSLDMNISISEISNFNIVTFSDGLRSISIDLNTLNSEDDVIKESQMTNDDIAIMSQLRLTEVLPNFYPSAILPENIPIKGRISKLLDYDTEKFKFYAYNSDIVLGYYISDESLNNYKELVGYAVRNGIFLSLMRCLNSITSEDGFSFMMIDEERLVQMMMTNKYADSSKVMMKLIEIDEETTFDEQTEISNIYGICMPYSMYYQMNSQPYRDILGDYYDDCEDDSDDESEDDDQDQTVECEIDKKVNTGSGRLLNDSDADSDQKSITNDSPSVHMQKIQDAINNGECGSNVSLNGVPIDVDEFERDYSEMDDDDMDMLFSEKTTFADDEPKKPDSMESRKSDDQGDQDSYIIKRR